MKLVLCTIVEASIFERSNVFDWQTSLSEFHSVRLPKVRRTSYSGLSVQTPGKVCLGNMERVGIIISKFERLSALLNKLRFLWCRCGGPF